MQFILILVGAGLCEEPRTKTVGEIFIVIGVLALLPAIFGN
jgi:hypothetical protein